MALSLPVRNHPPVRDYTQGRGHRRDGPFLPGPFPECCERSFAEHYSEPFGNRQHPFNQVFTETAVEDREEREDGREAHDSSVWGPSCPRLWPEGLKRRGFRNGRLVPSLKGPMDTTENLESSRLLRFGATATSSQPIVWREHCFQHSEDTRPWEHIHGLSWKHNKVSRQKSVLEGKVPLEETEPVSVKKVPSSSGSGPIETSQSQRDHYNRHRCNLKDKYA